MKLVRDTPMRRYVLLLDDLDLCNAEEVTMNYYQLPKDKRWIPDSPYEIGGRATDVSQIAYSLRNIVREHFPINKVPRELVDTLNALFQTGEIYEKQIQEFIEQVSDIVNEE